MITPIVIMFPHVAGARQGLAVLKNLWAEGLIALYASAVLVKDASGTVRLWAVDEGPFGLTVGASVGGVLGLPAGPVGAAIGAAGGATLGAVHEMRQEQGHTRFLQRAAGQVPPGWGAVVAEMAEFGECRLEARMRPLGGLVFRQARVELEVQAAYQQRLEVRRVIKDAWAEYDAAVATAAAVRDGRLAEAQSRLAESAQNLSLLDEYLQTLSEAGLTPSGQPAEQAAPGSRADLESQIAQTRGDHDQRSAWLEEAWGPAEAALAR